MNRRTFASGVIGILATPLAVTGQPGRKDFRIGFLLTSPREVQMHLINAFEAGMREKGYTPGRDVVIEYRSAEGQVNRLPELAADLVRIKVDVIVTGVNPAVLAAKQATSTIPIVMAGSFYPVEDGLVTSLARPGRNVTGLANEVGEESTKRLQLLREVVPKLTRVATLSGAVSYGRYFVTSLQDAARGLGVTVLPFQISSVEDINQAFDNIEHARADGLIVFGGPATLTYRSAIIALAAKNQLPAIWNDKERVVDGGLISYGADVTDLFRRSAVYVDRILKGARPEDLPIEQPARFVMAINLKTAKTIGLTIPQSLLLRADEVIQ